MGRRVLHASRSSDARGVGGLLRSRIEHSSSDIAELRKQAIGAGAAATASHANRSVASQDRSSQPVAAASHGCRSGAASDRAPQDGWTSSTPGACRRSSETPARRIAGAGRRGAARAMRAGQLRDGRSSGLPSRRRAEGPAAVTRRGSAVVTRAHLSHSSGARGRSNGTIAGPALAGPSADRSCWCFSGWRRGAAPCGCGTA